MAISGARRRLDSICDRQWAVSLRLQMGLYIGDGGGWVAAVGRGLLSPSLGILELCSCVHHVVMCSCTSVCTVCNFSMHHLVEAWPKHATTFAAVPAACADDICS